VVEAMANARSALSLTYATTRTAPAAVFTEFTERSGFPGMSTE
jgi:hypothetical protein